MQGPHRSECQYILQCNFMGTDERVGVLAVHVRALVAIRMQVVISAFRLETLCEGAGSGPQIPEMDSHYNPGNYSAEDLGAQQSRPTPPRCRNLVFQDVSRKNENQDVERIIGKAELLSEQYLPWNSRLHALSCPSRFAFQHLIPWQSRSSCSSPFRVNFRKITPRIYIKRRDLGSTQYIQ